MQITEIYKYRDIKVNGKINRRRAVLGAFYRLPFLFASITMVFSCIIWRDLAAQPEINSDDRTMRLASVSYPEQDSDFYRLHIYFKAPYQSFYFVKSDSLYKSKYQITFNISDARSQFYKTEIMNGEIESVDFNETKSNDNHIRHHVQIPVPPGQLVVEVQIEDLESSRSISEQYNIEVPASRDNPVAVSNPLFIRNPMADEQDMPDFFPSDDVIVANYTDSIYVSCFVYQKEPKDDASFHWRIVKKADGGEAMAEGNRKIDSKDKVTQIHAGFSGNVVPSGEMQFKVTCTSGQSKTENTWDFSVIWRKKPVAAYDIDAAARQMEYILPKNQYDVLQNKAGEEKKEYFLSLWKEKDPSPDIEGNELLEEYYYRVEYSNLKFASSFSEGWKTDRGRIFILLGTPDRIKRRYREFDSPPYEIWEYSTLARQYFFADKENTGDFKLVSIRE